jgi:hypothetical protein
VSLPHTNWRYVGSSAFTTASLPVVMDAIYSLGTATTYQDSTARTPGSGSAGTWTKVQVSSVTECVYVTPAEAGIDHRIMIGGATYTPNPSPTMGPNTSYSANTLMANVVKNAGTFDKWNSDAPFTTGETFGWWDIWNTSVGTGTVYLWESKDCIAVLIANSAGNSMYGFFGGAIIDPESSDTTVDSESDGKVYGQITSGTSAISGQFHSQGDFLDHQQFGSRRAGVFSPGSGSVLQISRVMRFQSDVSTTGMKNRSGSFSRAAIIMRSNSPDNCLGRLRDIYAFTDSQVPAKQTDGGSTIGYIYGASASSFADCVLLEH